MRRHGLADRPALKSVLGVTSHCGHCLIGRVRCSGQALATIRDNPGRFCDFDVAPSQDPKLPSAVVGRTLSTYALAKRTAVSKQTIVEQFQGLSTADKIELLDQLWQDIAHDIQGSPVSGAERRFLDQRLADLQEDARPDRDWQDVRDELLQRR